MFQKHKFRLPIYFEALQTGRDLSDSHFNVPMDRHSFALDAGHIYICPAPFSVILILLLLNC